MNNNPTISRHNRQTGTEIRVVPAADFGVDCIPDELTHFVFCVPHCDGSNNEGFAGFATKAAAIKAAANPLSWCRHCFDAQFDDNEAQ